MKSMLFGTVVLLGMALPAHAATLTGDSVTVSLQAGLVVGSGTVGAGNDVTIGNTFYDLDAGANGDEFVLTIDGVFCGLINCPGTTTVELSSLNFSGGASLIGFTLLSSVFEDVTWTTTATSILFSFTDQPGSGPIVMLSGRFVTDASPVPVPAALPLLASGLGALGFAGWRRRKPAAA